MYSPKIPERLIPQLYRSARSRGMPMTHLVAEALDAYLASQDRLANPPSPNGTGIGRADSHQEVIPMTNRVLLSGGLVNAADSQSS